MICERLLKGDGHRFATGSDSEVIIHLYEQHGERSFAMLQGMFAFALYDRRCDRVFVVRDRLGIKPLFWYRAADFILCASEMTALFADKSIPRQIDRQAVAEFLTLGYTLSPRTIFAAVEAFPPAHYLTFSIEDRSWSLHRYWDQTFRPKGEHDRRPIEDMGDEFRELFDRVVQSHAMADTRVGAYLSGGIDSTAATLALARSATAPVPTFSMSFPDTPYDESAFFESVAGSAALLPTVVPINDWRFEDLQRAVATLQAATTRHPRHCQHKAVGSRARGRSQSHSLGGRRGRGARRL